MNVINSRFCLLALAGSTVLSPLPLDAREDSSPMDMARQLNQAFIEVADQVSPAVVVIRVAHKPNFSDPGLDEENPLWDLIPKEFRKQLEEQQQQRERERQRRQGRERAPKSLPFDGQGSGVV